MIHPRRLILALLSVLLLSTTGVYAQAPTPTNIAPVAGRQSTIQSNGLSDESMHLIRMVNRYAFARGYRGGFPTFETADYHDGRGPVWGAILLKSDATDFQDIPASQLDTSSGEAL